MNSTRPRSLSGSDSLEDRQLTKRQNEVMRCFAKGLYYKEIASELGISYSAVHKHQHNIFVKFYVCNAREAISKWRDSPRT